MNLLNYIKRKPIIIEFHLLKFNEDMEAAWLHILEIYKTILQKDNYWHFFYEGDYSIIRCSRKYKNSIEKYLEYNDIEYRFKGEWNDGSLVVRIYNERFMHIFHEYSLLAIELKEEWLLQAADRVCHCFLNHCTYVAEGRREAHGINMWEGMLMGHIAVSRSHHIGMLDQDIKWKAHVDKTMKEKEES